jgi:hypothetical protein
VNNRELDDAFCIILFGRVNAALVGGKKSYVHRWMDFDGWGGGVGDD